MTSRRVKEDSDSDQRSEVRCQMSAIQFACFFRNDTVPKFLLLRRRQTFDLLKNFFDDRAHNRIVRPEGTEAKFALG